MDNRNGSGRPGCPAGSRRGGEGSPRRAQEGHRPPGRAQGGGTQAPVRAPKGAPQEPRRVSPARVAALEALLEVDRQGAYSGLALDRVLKKADLSDADRRLCTELFYGTLEKRLYLDYAIRPYLRRPFNDDVMDEILRMAVYQTLFLDKIPENAVCSEAVELVRLRGREALCPVTNGILRAFLRREGEIPLPPDPKERLSLETGTPVALIDQMAEQMGMDAAAAFLRAPADRRMTVRVSPLNWTMQEMKAFLDSRGNAWEPSLLPDALRVQGGGLASALPFREGRYAIMSESSMMACLALGVKNGWHVLDACAAPGGKSCYIAELMMGTGRVTSMDIHPHRVELIAAYARRMRLDNVRPRVADASQIGESLLESMDAVLVDAPCSGLGVLHSKPDIRYNTTPEKLVRLPETQLEILESAARTVRPGGVLVYATCTILNRENRDVVRTFLASHPEFRPGDLSGLLPDAVAEQARDGMLERMPDAHCSEGFFIARMVKAGRAR